MTKAGLYLRGHVSPAVWAFAAVVLTQLLYVRVTGIRGVPFITDSNSYSILADRLINDGFRYDVFLGHTTAGYPPVLYLVWITLVAWARLWFSTNWEVALAGLNIIAGAVTAAMVAGLAQRATRAYLAGIVAGIIYCGAFDLFDWNRYIMGDASFVVFAFAPFCLLALGLLRRSSAWQSIGAALLVFCVTFFYRPTSITLIPVLAIGALLVAKRSDAVAKVERRPRIVYIWLACILGVCAIGFFLFARLMQHPELWPFGTGADVVDYTVQRYQIGEVVWDRHDTFHAVPQSYLDFLWLVVDRFFHFFYFANGAFSLQHAVVLAAFYIPVYAFALRAVILAGSTAEMDGGSRLVIFLAAAMVIVTAAFHGMVQVDYGWRYRAPIIPHLILLSAIGAAPLLGRIANRWVKDSPED